MSYLFAFQDASGRFINIKDLLKSILKFLHTNNIYGKAKFQLCQNHPPCMVYILLQFGKTLFGLGLISHVYIKILLEYLMYEEHLMLLYI